MTDTSTLDQLIAQFVKRRRRLRATGVFCLAIALAMTWLLIGAVIDRFLALPPSVRMATLMLLGIVIGLATMRIAQLFFGRQFDKLIAARQIESMEPVLRDRLITVVTQQNLPPAQRGSEQITGLIATDVTATLAKRPPENLITNRHIAPAMVVLGLITIVTIVLATIPWLGLPKLIARQIMPLADIPPVTTTRINVVTGSVDLPQGRSLAVVADITRGKGETVLLVGTDDQSLQPVAMARTFADRFAVTLSSVERDLIYRIRAGDALSPAYHVRILTRPAIARLRVKLDFPEYLLRQPLTTDSSDGRIEAMRGTQAHLMLTSTEPLKDAALKIDGNLIPTTPTIDPYVREAAFTVNNSSEWSIEMTSQRDVPGSGFDAMQIVCVEDRAPIVQFVRSDLRLHPSDIAAVPFQVIDDFGVDRLQLDVQSGDRKLVSKLIDLATDRRMIRDVATVDLAPHGLAFGDVVTMSLTATDGAGQVRTGTPCRILLSPRSVDPRVLRRIDAIGEALQFAKSIPQRPSDSAACLRSLLQALATSDTPALSDYLQTQIDRAQRLTSAQVWGPPQFSEGDLKLASELVQMLTILHQGQQARLLQAEIENVSSAEARRKELTRIEREALQASIARARSELDSRLTGLQIAPRSADIQQKLQALIDTENSRYVDQKPPTMKTLAERWMSGQEMPILRDRVAIAAQAQVLRSDSDLPWARDMQIIARAMTRLAELSEAKPADFVSAVALVESLHHAVVSKSADHTNLIEPAEAARKKLREWAGENVVAENPPERNRFADAIEKPAAIQEKHDREMEQAATGDNDGPEVWQPPSDNKQSDPADQQAAKLSAIAQQQQRVAKRTESATPASAGELSSQQQQVADALKQVEQDREEDFFDKNDTTQHEHALEALRDAQRTLSDLPQQVADLKRQAETLASMKAAADRAQSAAQSASDADRNATQRAADEAQRQADQAAQQLSQAAASVSGGASQSLQASAGKLGALGAPMSEGAKQLAQSLQSLEKSVAATDLPGAAKHQAGVLDTVANLQASLRVTQRKVVDRDPIVAARFYAQRAAEAMRQQPPDLSGARAYQKETGDALRGAWDAAMARNVKDKLEQLPAFQSLFFDELTMDAAGQSPMPLLLDRTMTPEWGRLRDKQTNAAGASGTTFVPQGYEQSIRLYFQTLDQAKSRELK